MTILKLPPKEAGFFKGETSGLNEVYEQNITLMNTIYIPYSGNWGSYELMAV